MPENLVCWKCGASIADLPFPLARHASCSVCGAQLHVCKQCKFYDKTRSNQCQEPIAEPVYEKEKANFCELFQVKANAYQTRSTTAAEAAKSQLDALFGGKAAASVSSHDPKQAKTELEKLFGLDNNDAANGSLEKNSLDKTGKDS
ncbi:MAG: hypothetical protein L0Z73_15215 [Gammaproteobacteria bacterium]|nr:hypothetical protein [Gammaproteobacteria bacterium]